MSPKLKYYSFLVLLFAIPLHKTLAIQDDNTKNILIIFSLNQGLIAYQILLENFKNILREEYSKPYKMYVEYLNVGDFPDTSYQQFLFKRINEKYKELSIDLLILGGPRIVPLIKTYASDYIKYLPTISMDLFNPFERNPEYSIHPNTTEILEHFNVKKIFELAFSLFPDYNSVFIISGSSQPDQFFNKLTLIAAEGYKNQKKIVNLVNLSVYELIQNVNEFPEKSIILIPTFLMDVNNIRYNTPEIIRLIKKHTSTPIFVLFDTPFNDGAFGGYVLSEAVVGTECARATIKMLNGQNPNSIKIDSNSFNRYMFDWRELKRFGLEDSKFIPTGSIILHKEGDFIEENKWLLSGILLFIILQTLLIANLIRLNRKQKLTTIKLQETENRFRELAREDRIMRMGELTASLSHELNQPLTAIRNSAQAGLRFMQSGKSNPEMMNEILHNIVEDDKRAADVLSSIRQLMRFEKREKQKINLNPTIKQAADIFNGELKKHDILLQLILSESSTYVWGDGTQLQQVILNFVSNAANAIEEAENGNRSINIIEKIENEKVTISVRDYGIGISESIKSKLFKPFVTTREKGFGIGLAISKTIIDEHGGKIWAENNTDGGATFSFQLNLYKDEQS